MNISHVSSPFSLPLADFGDALPTTGWIVAGILVVGTLGVFGFSELLRLSLGRIWAIGGVCFRESIRKRVLWIIPLAIIGVIIVSQLERGFDEQEIIRQTTKFCMFATGLVVTMVSIILACTNLPKEIDNRVIYTIVTKPTTRLELILGKTVGFARVTALILLIMGVFTYTYLKIRTWSQQQQVVTRLATDLDIDPAEQNKLEHYRLSGLLTSRGYATPVGIEVMAPLPPEDIAELGPDTSKVRSIFGDAEQELLFPIAIDRQRFFSTASDVGTAADSSTGIGENGLLIAVRLKWQRYGPQVSPEDVPAGTALPSPTPAAIALDVLDSKGFSLVTAQATFDPAFPSAKEGHTSFVELTPEVAGTPIPGNAGPIIQSKWVWAYVPPSQTSAFFDQPQVFIHVTGQSHNVQYFADNRSAFVMFTKVPVHGMYAPPVPPNVTDADRIWSASAAPIARGRIAVRGGQELTGRAMSDRHTPIGVFHFHCPPVADITGDGMVPMELTMSVEHGGDASDEQAAATDLTLAVRADGSSTATSPVELKLESKQVSYLQLPQSEVASGNFDVIVRCNSPSHVLGIEAGSMLVVNSQEPFAWSLTKSLGIMWMLTVLVVILSIFSSTFSSWPIAIVLTSVLLMGHWAVVEVADAADTSLGRSIATDMGLTDPNKAEAVASSVNALTSILQITGAALPDIDRFDAIDRLQNGRIISTTDLADALGVLIAFGVPAAALGFVSLKYKEVAP